MKLSRILCGALMLAACADKQEIQGRIDALEVDVTAEVVGDTGNPADGTASDATPTDTTGDTGAGDTGSPSDGTAPDSTTTDTGTGDTGTGDTGAGDTGPADTTADTSQPGDTVVTPWEVDPDAPWALGRPIAISGTDGAAEIAAPTLSTGRYSALVPIRIASGAVVADGRTFAAPDAGGHAAIAALSGGLEAPALGSVVYIDGPLSSPERPAISVCEGWIYATVNEQSGATARLVRLSADLEAISVALVTALPGLGHSVRFGAPVCGGPGFVVTLDAVGGASFTAPDGKKSEFAPNQTENKTLILNGTRVFAENAAQVVSANSMRILHLHAGPAKQIFYVGEATVQRQVGDTTLMPGDQLVYNHDYAAGIGGSIASQGWFGREDISRIATAADGRFAVVWIDITAGATPADPEVIEVVVSVFEADGARSWNRRSPAWAIDRVDFDAQGDVRIAGRFRSLEVIGIATAPVGLEDVFLAVLGDEGARLRHAVIGVPGLGASIVGPIFDAVGSGECSTAGALDAVLAVTGPTRVGVGVGTTSRCATQGLTANDGALMLTFAGATDAAQDASDFWLSLASGSALGAAHGSPWPAGGAHVGPIRARFVSPL